MFFDIDENLRVTFDDRGGKVLLVTFNEMEFRPEGREYWAQKPVEQLGMSCLGFVSKGKNWFPYQSMVAAQIATEDVINRFDRVILYGFSQGAYAALKYSKLLGATEVLSFSPQFSINSTVLEGQDERFVQFFNESLHKNMEISSSDVAGNVWIFYDPYLPEDMIHIDKINYEVPTVNFVKCNFVGHGTVRIVASTQSLKELLSGCLNVSKEKNFFTIL